MASSTGTHVTVRARLGAIVGDDAVADGAGSTGIAPGPQAPWLSVRPADTAQVQQIVALANETGTPLVPVSSSPPHRHGGSTPSVAGAVVVDLRAMDRVLRVDRRNRLALIEPGVTYEQLIPALAAEGLRVALPLLPRRGKSVLASLLEREPPIVPRWHWNAMEPLRSLEVVWGNGEKLYTGSGVFRGEKDEDWAEGRVPVTGGGPGQLDFVRMLVGAQGSMGIATWASVKCEPISDVQTLVFIPAARLEDLVACAYRLVRIRFGDELFVMNGPGLALMLARDGTDRAGLARELPAWCLVVGIGGGPVLGAEKVAAREQDIRDIVGGCGLAVESAIARLTAPEMLRLLQAPAAEPYWKDGPETGSEEVFFLTTLDRTPGFVATMQTANASLAEPLDGIGVYIQPIHQGVGVHCELILPFERSVPARAAAARELKAAASRILFAQGAYFSRPYGDQAAMVFAADPATTEATRTVKGIFDPRGVMNPGKLCFPGGRV